MTTKGRQQESGDDRSRMNAEKESIRRGFVRANQERANKGHSAGAAINRGLLQGMKPVPRFAITQVGTRRPSVETSTSAGDKAITPKWNPPTRKK